MSKMKKIAAWLIAMIMVLGMSTAAVAQTYPEGAVQDTDKGSITVSNATVGQTYTIYKLFDANPSGNNDTQIAYTASAAVYTWLSANDTAKNLFTFTANTADTYNVEKKTGVQDADIVAFLDSLITKNGDTTTVDSTLASLQVASTTATEQSLTFANVPFGYYVIQSSLGAAVSVDSTNKNVTIIDKNQEGPDWDIDEDHTGKALTDENGNILTTEDGTTVTENSANYGDVVYYAIGVNTTNYDGADQIINYFISDTLGNGLSYDKENVTVTVGTTALTAGQYTIVWNDANNSFEITIPWVDASFNSLYASPNTIKVTYKATVTDAAVIAGEGNKNTANFTYQKKNNEKIPYDEENKKETTTYVYALGLLKVATKTGDANIPLEGAKFTVKDSDGNAVNVVADSTAGEYKLDTRADGAGVTRSNEVVTPVSGVIIIKGLEAGTYTLTETEAPFGYNLLTAPVSIEASMAATTTYTQTIVTHYDADGHVISTEVADGSTITTSTSVNVVPVTVENLKGTELPSTGREGTRNIYIIGAILVIVAGVILVARRRMNAE